MIPNKPFQKAGVLSLALGAAFLLAQMKCDAARAQQQEQQQSQQPPPPPPPPTPSAQPASEPAPLIDQLPIKRRKVWTNDEVVSLRTPADNYRAEKEAKQAAAAEAAAKEAAIRAAVKFEKLPPLDIKLPATREETEKMVKDTQSDILEEASVLAKLQKELVAAPTEQQAQKQTEIDRLAAVLETSQRDLKALQDHLRTFREKPAEENPPAPSQPPTE